MNLTQAKCEPCESGIGKLNAEEVRTHLAAISGWTIDGHYIKKTWKFKNYVLAEAFVAAVGKIAESEGHHPDIRFGWGYVEVFFTTHAAKGLTRNDFIVAAKIDAIAHPH